MNLPDYDLRRSKEEEQALIVREANDTPHPPEDESRKPPEATAVMGHHNGRSKGGKGASNPPSQEELESWDRELDKRLAEYKRAFPARQFIAWNDWTSVNSVGLAFVITASIALALILGNYNIQLPEASWLSVVTVVGIFLVLVVGLLLGLPKTPTIGERAKALGPCPPSFSLSYTLGETTPTPIEFTTPAMGGSNTLTEYRVLANSSGDWLVITPDPQNTYSRMTHSLLAESRPGL